MVYENIERCITEQEPVSVDFLFLNAPLLTSTVLMNPESLQLLRSVKDSGTEVFYSHLFSPTRVECLKLEP